MAAFAFGVTTDETVECAECGVRFASPVIAQRRRDRQAFFCPNGHSQSFIRTTEELLRSEVQRLRTDNDWQRSQRETVQKRLTAQKAQTTIARNKLKRVYCGVCPECNRSFGNLARHMETKHAPAADVKAGS